MASVAGLVLASAAAGETITVCLDGSCDYDSIQAAIDYASDDDVIWISAGVYTPGAQIDTQGKAITLRGEFDKNGALATILDGMNTHRVAICQSGEGASTIFERVVFRNGLATDGAGMLVNGSSPTFSRCLFLDNTATFSGGGFHVSAGSPRLELCTFIGNLSEGTYGGGGLFSTESSPVLDDCLFENNSASSSYGDGGGAHFFSSGDPQVIDCVFTMNLAGDSGGGLFADPYGNASLHLECLGSAFTDNESSDRGGGLCLDSASANLVDCMVQGNLAVYGGGMWTDADTILTLATTTICGNDVDQVLFLGGWTDLGETCINWDCLDKNGNGVPDGCEAGEGSVLEVPQEYGTIDAAVSAAQDGDVIAIAEGTYTPAATINLLGKAITIRGAADKDGLPTTIVDGGGLIRLFECTSGERLDTRFENLVLINGNPGEKGGAFQALGSGATFMNCTFQDNSATHGGAIWGLSSLLTMDQCRFLSNSAGYAGAIGVDRCTTTISNCLFHQNTNPVSSGSFGGAFYMDEGNCTQSFNTYTENASYQGSAIHTQYGTSCQFESCTFQDNTGQWGIVDYESNATYTNCTFTRFLDQSGTPTQGYTYVMVNNDVAFTKCSFSGNAYGCAGTNYEREPQMSFSGCSFREFSQIVLVSTSASTSIEDCIFCGNGIDFTGSVEILSGNSFSLACFADCNCNGSDDIEDIASGHSEDVDRDGIPDECATVETITVDDDGAADYTTIQEAVDAAGCGALILVAPGTYSGIVDKENPNAPVVRITNARLTLRALEGPAVTVIEGSGKYAGIEINPAQGDNAIAIEGFTIQNTEGSAVECSYTSVELKDMVFLENATAVTSYLGGGFTLLDSQLVGQSLETIIVHSGSRQCRVEGCAFMENVFGAGILVGGWCTISNCSFEGTAGTEEEPYAAYAIEFEETGIAFDVSNCTFNGFSSAIHVSGDFEHPMPSTFKDCSFQNCDRGVDCDYASSVLASGCSFHAMSYGIVVIGNSDTASLTVHDCTFSEANTSIFSSRITDVEITQCSFATSESSGYPVNLVDSYSSTTSHALISNCTFDDLYLTSPRSIVHLLRFDEQRIEDCSFRTSSGGSALSLDPDHPAEIHNTLFALNALQRHCIDNLSAFHVIDGCTFTGNESGYGSLFGGSGFLLQDTIIEECCAFESPQDDTLPYVDGGGNTLGPWFCADCVGDVDCNNLVDGIDLTMILSAWGTTDSIFDLNQDGLVDGADLTYVLTDWGACP